MRKPKINNQRCPTCGKRMTANGNVSIPLPLDTRFKRATTSVVKTLQQIEATQGRGAARIALEELQKALKSY